MLKTFQFKKKRKHKSDNKINKNIQKLFEQIYLGANAQYKP